MISILIGYRNGNLCRWFKSNWGSLLNLNDSGCNVPKMIESHRNASVGITNLCYLFWICMLASFNFNYY